ncbi:hypothetical protein D3C75_1098760 [compost metagenome]
MKEIESWLLKLSSVQDVVVTVRNHQDFDKQIIAYVKSMDKSFEVVELRQYLQVPY